MSTVYNVLSFDGNDYVELADPFPDPTTFTISAWVKPEVINDGQFHAFLGKQEAGKGIASRKPGLWLTPDGSGLHLDSYTSEGKRYGYRVDNFFEKDTWVHVAWVKRGTKYEVYRNGALVSTLDAPEAFSRDGSSTYMIGQIDNFWIGEIADVRIWSVARSPEQIRDDMSRRLTGAEPGLSRYFPLNEGSGTTVRDLAGKTSGTIHGATWKQSEFSLATNDSRVSIGIVAVNPEGDQYVEMKVINGPYNLSGHRLLALDARKEFVFRDGTMLIPGKSLLVYTNKTADGSYSLGSATPLWKSKEDKIDLWDPLGRQHLIAYPSSRLPETLMPKFG